MKVRVRESEPLGIRELLGIPELLGIRALLEAPLKLGALGRLEAPELRVPEGTDKAVEYRGVGVTNTVEVDWELVEEVDCSGTLGELLALRRTCKAWWLASLAVARAATRATLNLLIKCIVTDGNLGRAQ